MLLSMRCSRCGRVADPARLNEDDSVFARLTPGRVTMNMWCRGCVDLMGWRKIDGLSLVALLMGMGFDHSPDRAGLAPLRVVSCMGCGGRFSPRKWGPDIHPRWRVTLSLQGGPFAMGIGCPRCSRGEAVAGPIVGGYEPEQVAAMFIDVLLFVFPATLGGTAVGRGPRSSGRGPSVG